ncbi:MAG: hypothetical protein AAB597_00725 [Patescibacteria group bacterium]
MPDTEPDTQVRTNQFRYKVERKRRPTILFEYPERLRKESVFVLPHQEGQAVMIYAHTLDGGMKNILVEQKW